LQLVLRSLQPAIQLDAQLLRMGSDADCDKTDGYFYYFSDHFAGIKVCNFPVSPAPAR
jgi:hypothetical protein